MAKQRKEKAAKPHTGARRQMHAIHLWEFQHHPDRSEVEIYSEISGEWEIPIVTSGANHVALAEFIVDAANERNQTPSLLNEALAALQVCIDSNELPLKAEQAAQGVLRKASSK